MATLLVASTGGHLKELHHLHRQLPDVTGPFRWVTFDTPQSRSLLDRKAVDFVRFIGDRDAVNAIRSLGEARHILRDHEVKAVVSTGAAIALPFIGLARARRLPCHYVESAARIDGPSLTGRLVSGMPGVRLYTQCPGWANAKWRYGGSVFDSFKCVALPYSDQTQIGKVVVTLGTTKQMEFPRIIRRLLKILPPEADVLWQTGNTDTSDLGISGYAMIPERDLTQAMREADVVVSHAGVGTALAAFEVGKCPVLVPRRPSLGELVDDHQLQIAGELGDRGLSVSVEADDLTYDDLLTASKKRVTMFAQAPSLAKSAT